ncbi:MAG: PorT family protein, partial [Chitinophagaceae bacterium]|nr:PorT family protein [Chitinophagaceae bacterium]
SWENIQKRIRKQNRPFNLKSIGLSAVLLLGFAISTSDEQSVNKENQASLSNKLSGNEAEQTKIAAVSNSAKVIPITSIRRSQQNQQELPVLIQANENIIEEENNNVSPVPVTDEEIPSLTKATVELNTVVSEPSLEVPSVILSDNNNIEINPIVSDKVETSVTTVEHVPANTVPSQLEVNIPVINADARLYKKLQFYITSSASYRVLYSDNKINFGNLNQQNPDQVARHTPSLGFEFGGALLLPLSKNIHFRTGLQINYTRYNVEVFRAAPQLATVVLNNNTGVIQRVTSLNTQNSAFAKSDEVANETYQLSIPVGFEFKLAGKRSLQWHLATNVQPTYLLSASGYLLTNNFEKYIKAPDLLSNLNLNSSLETFLRWNMKDIQLQAGPQLRYQLFSNSQEGYPIKEHLVDYGFRIGIIKTLR